MVSSNHASAKESLELALDGRRAQRDGYMSSYCQLVDTFNTKAEDEGLNPEEANEVVNFECAHLFIFFRIIKKKKQSKVWLTV